MKNGRILGIWMRVIWMKIKYVKKDPNLLMIEEELQN